MAFRLSDWKRPGASERPCKQDGVAIRILVYILLLLFVPAVSVVAQDAGQYVKPGDKLVLKKLDQWQEKKFGLFMHWGPYSQWGILESWTLCPEDRWPRTGPHSHDYATYKKAYEQLQTTFNPVAFNPEKWVRAAKNAGMGYVVFTTKHHDGFCMFDTKQTDYAITSKNTPFSANPRSNITKEIFEAFRKEGFMVGAYFSKPDWHSEYYWWPYFPPRDRNVNYDPKKFPERWDKFKRFTHDQIEELMTGYGQVDILWLDGGWVRPDAQDIGMSQIAAMGRKHQPGLIVVDRTVSGEFENYTTPEQEVPDRPLTYPWETCMTMGDYWSYVPGDRYKPTHQLIENLIKIVSRGGNFLLNVAPDANGDWDPVVYERLDEIGQWMKINGEGIHGSAPVAPYSVNNIYFTQAGDQNTLYAFWISDKDDVSLPDALDLPLVINRKIKNVSALGAKEKLGWEHEAGNVHITMPSSLRTTKYLKHCVVFKIALR